jgi:hypothetical protein
MIVPAVILIVAGLGLVWLAVASWQERLPRNGLAGVRRAVLLGSGLACAAICIAGAVRGVRACRTL